MKLTTKILLLLTLAAPVFAQKTSLTAFSAEPPQTGVFGVLQTRLNANTLAGFSPAARIDSLARTLRADGSWPDLDYADKSRSRWQPSTHWDRILLLTQAYRSARHPAFNRPELKAKIETAIAYWNAAKPVSENYWWNAIGVPLKMGEALLLLDAPPRTQTMALMKLGIKPDFYNYHGPATGQNQVWLATIHLMAGVLERDSLALRRAFTALHDEIKITTAEGIQPDWSFHQHGTILYAGGYGLAFTRDQARLIQLAQGTPYSFPAQKVADFSGYVLDGQQWMIRGRTFDHSARGREIARPLLADSKLKGGLPAVGQLLASLDVPRRAEFSAMAGRMTGNGTAPMTGNRHFWRSDYLAHHRPGFFSSVKMASVRTTGSESGNGENEQAYFLGHGVQLLYRTGQEYTNIFPVWNWRRLPGHLGEQSPEPMPLITWGKGSEGSTAFVGGASDGSDGLAAYDYRRGNVRAKRAWFHFGDDLACLGAGMSCPTDYPLFQTLNQCHLKSEVLVSGRAAAAPRTLPSGQHALPQTRWVWHDSVAYVFPNAPTVHVRNDVQTGSWRGINNSPAQSDEVLRLPVFNAWLDFGTRVRNQTYFYLIRPGVSVADLKTDQNPVLLLRNDTTAQAVRHSGLNAIQAAFYQPGSLDDGQGLTIAVSQPVVLMLKANAEAWDLTVANPTNVGGTVVVTLNKKVACEGCTWSATRRTTTVPIALPDGTEAGRSVTKRVRKS